MDNGTWQALEAIPLDELRRRAAIINDLREIPTFTVDGAQRYAWNDGGGQSAVWYFTPDGRALLLTFDHEEPLNLFAEGGYPPQKALFDGVPEDLVRLVRNRPENYESLNVRDEETGDTLHHAGGVYWYDGERWRVADGLVAHCERENLDPFINSGFAYCLDWYLLDRALTPETLVGFFADDGLYKSDAEREADLLRFQQVFAQRD